MSLLVNYLGGQLRPVRGVLPAAIAALQAGRALIVPYENADEASLIQGLRLSREALASGSRTFTRSCAFSALASPIRHTN